MKTVTKAPTTAGKTAKRTPAKKVTVKREIESCFTPEVKEAMKKSCFKHHGKNSCGGIYFFGFVGAAIYFMGQATDFWPGIVGFLKAIARPAFLVHGLLKFLGI